MYEELFQTPDRPFRATPDVRFYFAFDSMEQTRQTILRVIRRAEGPAAVMGSVGLGKSLMAQLLSDDLKDRFDVVRLHAARLCSRRAMLQSILFELQLPYRDLSEGELRLSLMERMEPAPLHAPDGLVLIVDEAQTLPTKLLEELRLITNFARQGQSRARMVLLGSMHLEETFALPEMSSFNQRLAARCFLQPMNRQQTADFVKHQFTCVHVDPKHIITRDALDNVYAASEGIPRLVNQVMDHALILAIANDQYPISAALIQEAWSDLQQLPMGWNDGQASNANPVEFGSIDDLDQDFELEPEGADDLDLHTASSMHWPAPSDLEDFGPACGSQACAQNSADDASSCKANCQQECERPAFQHSIPSADAASVQPRSRVVFDASAMFADNQKTSAQPSSAQADISDRATAAPQLKPFDSVEADHDLFIFQEDDQTTFDLSMATQNQFAAWEVRDGGQTNSGADAIVQAQTSARVPDMTLEPSTGALPLPLARAHTPVVCDPFGQDFDEEFTVDASDVRRWQERERDRQSQAVRIQAMQTGIRKPEVDRAIDNSARLLCEESLVKENSTAPTVATQRPEATACMPAKKTVQPELITTAIVSEQTVSPSNLTESAVLAIPAAELVEQFILQPQAAPGAALTDYVAMTGTGAVDERLQREIEDLISQLNFSAFSVETDSVEQISPEFTREPASAPKYLDSHSNPAVDAEVASYRMRTAEPPAPEMTHFDDRDLLVIDEDIPASVRHQSPATGAPTNGTMSYPQLFQQLRG